MKNPKETITTWEEPGYKMGNTSHGSGLTYLQWCMAECDRIFLFHNVICEVVYNGRGCCAVAEVVH